MRCCEDTTSCTAPRSTVSVCLCETPLIKPYVYRGIVLDRTESTVYRRRRPPPRSRWILLGQQQHTLGVGKLVKKRAQIYAPK